MKHVDKLTVVHRYRGVTYVTPLYLCTSVYICVYRYRQMYKIICKI